jgi:hypothetical protein
MIPANGPVDFRGEVPFKISGDFPVIYRMGLILGVNKRRFSDYAMENPSFSRFSSE